MFKCYRRNVKAEACVFFLYSGQKLIEVFHLQVSPGQKVAVVRTRLAVENNVDQSVDAVLRCRRQQHKVDTCTAERVTHQRSGQDTEWYCRIPG